MIEETKPKESKIIVLYTMLQNVQWTKERPKGKNKPIKPGMLMAGTQFNQYNVPDWIKAYCEKDNHPYVEVKRITREEAIKQGLILPAE